MINRRALLTAAFTSAAIGTVQEVRPASTVEAIHPLCASCGQQITQPSRRPSLEPMQASHPCACGVYHTTTFFREVRSLS